MIKTNTQMSQITKSFSTFSCLSQNKALKSLFCTHPWFNGKLFGPHCFCYIATVRTAADGDHCLLQPHRCTAVPYHVAGTVCWTADTYFIWHLLISIKCLSWLYAFICNTQWRLSGKKASSQKTQVLYNQYPLSLSFWFKQFEFTLTPVTCVVTTGLDSIQACLWETWSLHFHTVPVSCPFIIHLCLHKWRGKVWKNWSTNPGS